MNEFKLVQTTKLYTVVKTMVVTTSTWQWPRIRNGHRFYTSNSCLLYLSTTSIYIAAINIYIHPSKGFNA